MQRTAFGVTPTKTRTSAPYNGDDWDDMRQDDPDEWQPPAQPPRAPARAEQPREPAQRPSTPPAEPQATNDTKRPRGRPKRKAPDEPEKPQDRTPRDGYQHFLIRNISKDTINTLDALAKAEMRSLNFIIIRILDDYANER